MNSTRDITIVFEENTWWMLAGFLVIFGFVVFLGVRAFKEKRSFQRLLLLLAVVSGSWISGLYANQVFFSFTKLQRQNDRIIFRYYFGWARNFYWRDVQKIFKEPFGKNSSRIRFVMRNGKEIASVGVRNDDVCLAETLSLEKELRQRK